MIAALMVIGPFLLGLLVGGGIVGALVSAWLRDEQAVTAFIALILRDRPELRWQVARELTEEAEHGDFR